MARRRPPVLSRSPILVARFVIRVALHPQQSCPGLCWHWLRHANATLLDAVGTPLGTVQDFSGTRRSKITREVYLHSVPAMHGQPVEKVKGLLNGH
jgi:hypothetical protein